MAKKKARRPLTDPESGNATLGDLLRARGIDLGPTPTADGSPAPQPKRSAPSTGGDLSGCGKVVLRRTRKGRGGKTVTEISGLGLPPARLAALAKRLRKSLGCGGRVEGDLIVLHGDLGARADAWLKVEGVKRTVVC